MMKLRRTRIFGVDFSGARDAGRKIWIARGEGTAKELWISRCSPATEYLGCCPDRESALQALVRFIQNERSAVFGLDFPFGIPKELVREKDWKQFVLRFCTRYFDTKPEVFREECRRNAPGRERKRATDKQSRTPFSPYNLRLYRQTFYGIRDVLAPLVKGDLARVVPMQDIKDDKPCLVEICPASKLKVHGRYTPYKDKGRKQSHQKARDKILAWLEKEGPTRIESLALRTDIVRDRAGDALDSVIAACAVFDALEQNFRPPDPAWRTEGYVYTWPVLPGAREMLVHHTPVFPRAREDMRAAAAYAAALAESHRPVKRGYGG